MVTIPRIQVALVDDHKLFREGIKKVLQHKEDINFIWEAADGEELLVKLKQLPPDVLLLDLHMPQSDGINLLPLIHKENAQVKVIVLSMDDSPEMISHAITLGANTFLSKNTEPEVLYKAIVDCMKQDYYFTDQMNHALLHQMQRNRIDQKEPIVILSEKERFVLQALAAEKSNEEMALEGGINP